MRIVGIVGSPRSGGNSFCLANEALAAAREAEPSLETEIIQPADYRIGSCKACETCGQLPFKCVQSDDFEMLLDPSSSPSQSKGDRTCCPSCTA